MSGIDFYISNIEDVTLPAMRKELELFEVRATAVRQTRSVRSME